MACHLMSSISPRLFKCGNPACLLHLFQLKNYLTLQIIHISSISMVKKPKANDPLTPQITAYFPRLPISKTHEYFVRDRDIHTLQESLPVPHKGKLPKPAQRNIHNDTCVLHQVIGCEPDYVYAIDDITAVSMVILKRILLSEVTNTYRQNLLYSFALHLIDKNKQSVYCYARQQVCLKSKLGSNLVAEYRLCFNCMRHVVYDLELLEFAN